MRESARGIVFGTPAIVKRAMLLMMQAGLVQAAGCAALK